MVTPTVERLKRELWELEKLDTKRSRAEAAVLLWVLGVVVVGPVEATAIRSSQHWLSRIGQDLDYDKLGPLVPPDEVAVSYPVVDCRA